MIYKFSLITTCWFGTYSISSRIRGENFPRLGHAVSHLLLVSQMQTAALPRLHRASNMAGRSPSGPALSRAASASAPTQDNAFKVEYITNLIVGQAVEVLKTDGELISGLFQAFGSESILLSFPLRKVSACAVMYTFEEPLLPRRM